MHMHLGIEQETRIMDIQKAFNAAYPYLKLEFFKNPSPQNKISQKLEKLSPGVAVKNITHFYNPGSIHLDDKKTVEQLVNDFWEYFGLSVLVFRRSGNLWIETSLTDSWTLDRQNKIGESFSTQADNI